jgi:hypothetical protein
VPEVIRPERLARYQPLAAGQYWRAKEACGEFIDAGVVLLVTSVRLDQDRKIHTICLRPHPRHFARRDFHTTEHRFLVDDFLAKFEVEPDAARIREAELGAAQGEITRLQQELLEAQASPLKMAQAIEAAGLTPEASGEDETQKAKFLALVSSQSQVLASASTRSLTHAAGGSLTQEQVASMRAVAVRSKAMAEARAAYLKSATGRIADAIKALTPYYEEQAAAALAATDEVRQYIESILSGIQSLDLYTGKDVEVTPLTQGASAAADEPLCVLQRKLFADEEAAVFVAIEEWFDFSSLDLFFDALKKYPGLVAQMLPAPRAIVAVGATRRAIDYGHALANEVLERRNRSTFLLVRDGENLYCVRSGLTRHLNSARLFPTIDEQGGYFRGFDGQDIRMDDLRYTDSLRAHDLAALTYKQFLILIAGLDHRLSLFGRFYEGPASMEFVSMTFQQAHMRLIADDDDGLALPGERPYPELVDWLKEANGFLAPGSRVLCATSALMNPDTAPGVCRKRWGRLIWQYRPRCDYALARAYKHGAELRVKIPVSGTTNAGEPRAFESAVSLSKYRPHRYDNGDVLAWLVLDSVTPQALDWFIHDRTSRSKGDGHLSYIRFFKEALAVLKSEEREQAETRAALKKALDDGGIGQKPARADLVSKAIRTWRAAHRGIELPAPGASGWDELLAQMFHLQGRENCLFSPTALSNFAASLGLTALRHAVSGRGQHLLYASAGAAEQDDRIEPFAWVRQLVVGFSRKGPNTGFKQKSSSWVKLRPRASETIMHEWEGASDWEGRPSAFDSPEHKQAVFDLAARGAATLATLKVDGAQEPAAFSEILLAWHHARTKANERRGMVVNPELCVPIGVCRDARGKVGVVCARHAHPEALLFQMALKLGGGRENSVRKAFTGIYQDGMRAQERFDQALTQAYPWDLAYMSVPSGRDPADPWCFTCLANDAWRPNHFADKPELRPALLSAQVDALRRGDLEGGALFVAGEAELDSALGLALAADYELVRRYDISFSREGEAPGEPERVILVEPAAGPVMGFDDLRALLLGHDLVVGASLSYSKSLHYSRKEALSVAGEGLAWERIFGPTDAAVEAWGVHGHS